MGHPVEFRYRQYVPPGNYDGGSREYLRNVRNYRREVTYDLWASSRVRSVFVVRALLVSLPMKNLMDDGCGLEEVDHISCCKLCRLS